MGGAMGRAEKSLPVILLLLAAILAVSALLLQSVSTTPFLREDHSDYKRFLKALRATGAAVATGNEAQLPLLSTSGKHLTLRSEGIEVFEYANASAALSDAERIAANHGAALKGTGWLGGPPHLYRKGRIIVLYAGNESAVLETLEQLLGAPFAEGSE